MFKFTKFVVVDAVDNNVGMLLVSFSNRYVVYNANRRRIVTDIMRTSVPVDPAMLVTDANLLLWLGSDSYRVNKRYEVESLSYTDAVLYTNDRYDINQMMRYTFTPTGVRTGNWGTRYERNRIGDRVNAIIESYVRKQTGSVVTVEPHARFKGGYYYTSTTFLTVRNAFKEFGHLLAQAAAGCGISDNYAIREAFLDLDNRYHDFTGHIESAYDACNRIVSDFGIVHCDCGHYEGEDHTHDVRNDTWCDSCFDDDAVYVEDEDEYWPRDDAYYSESRDAYYSYDRDEDDDSDDDDDDRNNPIMSYSTNVLSVLGKSSPIISSQFGEFTMGIELEMSSGDSPSESSAESVRSRLGSEYCIIKHDGSLPHNGFEIVTTPQGLSVHIDKFKAWDIDPAYRAWNTGKCGMHVHIDSRAFTQMTLGKFLMFINSSANMDFIRKIAGRHPMVDDQARSYCSAEHQSILTNPKQAVKGKSGERYRMVNLCNLGFNEAKRLGLSMDNSYNGKYNTVELRIFRASLKKERLLAQIEFTHASVMFCRVASWRDLNGASFIKWLKSVAGQYPALVKWYGVRNVHTSTPTVIAPAEVTCTDAVPPPVSRDYRHAHDQDHGYHLVIPYDNSFGISNYASQHGLYFTYFRCASLQLNLVVFPYSGDETTIGDDDVIYVHDIVDNVWRLQEDDFNAIIREHNPVQANASVPSSI